MEGFELFLFLLCLIVFIGLVGLFSVLISIVAKQQLKLIRTGKEDDRIKKDAIKKKGKYSKLWNIVERCFSILLCCLLLVVLISSIVVGYAGDNRVVKNIPAMKVVSSTSMATKNEKNTYLIENNLNDQLLLFDLVILHELPKEEDIKLYDIIVYETADGVLIIHRVIGIEEPNDKHPNERWFQFKGDAVEGYDRFPVKYSQMKSIYKGERIPNVGSFVFFMQSPAGTICFILAVLVLIVMPFVEDKFRREETKRIILLIGSGEVNEEELKEEYKKALLKEKGGENEKG